jgi:D-alanyl-D-alanine carboxypeptidase (penicillin-binding protein 5/6)
MTAIVALENSGLDKVITISQRASNIEPSKAGLKKGTKYKIRDLLYACLVSSSNDAAFSLAEGIAGKEETFVRLMNKKAKRIGMKDTHFINSTGLPSYSSEKEQYSTVYDLSILMRYCLSRPQIIEFLSTKEKYIQGSDSRRIRLINHNKLLFRKSIKIIGKTGYTKKAKHCFVGAVVLDSKKIVFAILASKKPWQDLCILINHGLYYLNNKAGGKQGFI